MAESVVNGTTPETFLLPLNCAEQQWCLDWYGYVNYIPSLGGNAFFLAAFVSGLVAQVVLGIRYRAWTFTGPMLVGIILEVVGYGGRIGMHGDVFSDSWFIMYLCCLTIGPALFSASLYLSLSRIITIYGRRLSLLQPRTITLMFIGFDILSLVLQAVGGALASTASDKATGDAGVNIMISGLSTQLVATTSFALLCVHLMVSIRRHPERVDSNDADTVAFRKTKWFRAFLCAVGIAVVAILVRCAFRVAELSEGFNGKLANDEVLFFIFDSTMMVICVAVLCAAHPGMILGHRWKLGQVSFRGRRTAEPRTGVGSSEMGSSEKRGQVTGASSETTSENRLV